MKHGSFVHASLIMLAAAPLAAQTTSRISVGAPNTEADLESYSPALSADGRFVAFFSEATNLVAGDTNGAGDAFVRDRLTKTTIRVSVSSAGTEANASTNAYYYIPVISDDGRFVAFQSSATNLVPLDTNGFEDVFVRDTLSGTTVRANVDSSGAQANADCFDVELSADGRYVAFTSYASNLVAGDTNAVRDVFVHDLVTGTTVRASLNTAGGQVGQGGAYPSISADGRYVAFASWGLVVPGDTNVRWDIFVRDLVAGTSERVSVGTGGVQAIRDCLSPSISADGRFVAFETYAGNLAPGDTNADWDVFVHDRLTGTTTLCSANPGGVPANASSLKPVISGDGTHVAFKSIATDLVPGDDNQKQDVFVRDLVRAKTVRVSVNTFGHEANGESSQPAISADGRHVGFYSNATNLVPADGNDESDLFVRSPAKVARD